MPAHSRITQRPLFYWVLRRQRLFQFFLLLLIMTGVFFRVFPLEMQKRIVNTAIELKNESLLFLYCGLYIGAVILSSGLKYAANVLQKNLGQKILVEIRKSLYAHILTLPLQFFRKTPPGTVISAMTAELNSVGHFIGGAIAVPLTSLLTLLTFAGYMIWLDPVLGLISVAVYPVELVLVPMLQRRYNRLNVKRIDAVRAMSNTIGEAVSGIHEIQGNAGFEVENKKTGHWIDRLFRLMKQIFVVKYGVKFVNNFFQNLGPFLLFLIGGYLAIHGRFTLGALVAFLSAYEKVYDPWKELIEYYQGFQDARVRYQRVMTHFDIEPEFDMHPAGRMPFQLEGEITIDRLGYTVDRHIQLLNDISLHLKPGEHLALTGFSGSGKSTLALLTGQLYGCTGGSIVMDGHDLKKLSKADVSLNIGFVAQHPFIFDGTLRENLLYGCRAVALLSGDDETALPDESRIIEMIKTVGFADDLVRFGLNQTVRPDRKDLIKSVLRMRLSMYQKLASGSHPAVEFFDIRRFIRHMSIYRNILFGDFSTEEYRLGNLPENRQFLSFLKETGLEAPLVEFGLTIANENVFLLQALENDAFFLEGSPIKAGEFEAFKEILDRAGLSEVKESAGLKKLPRKDRLMLLMLALRYTPSKHKMAVISEEFEEKIIAARHRFIEEIGGMNLSYCKTSLDKFIRGEDPGEPILDENDSWEYYCPGEYFKSRTLLENIIFGAPHPDTFQDADLLNDEVIRHLSSEGFLDDVMKFGLEFQAGSKGDRLSGGQKQKIAIARALLKEPSVLILDEATASLDNQSQARIHDYIQTRLKGRVTLISVIHRLDMADAYDKIAVLQSGRMVEYGSYKELMNKKGIFYGLVQGNASA